MTVDCHYIPVWVAVFCLCVLCSYYMCAQRLTDAQQKAFDETKCAVGEFSLSGPLMCDAQIRTMRSHIGSTETRRSEVNS